MKTAAVIPVGPGREQNLTRVVKSLAEGSKRPHIVVVVLDGPDAKVAPELASVCLGLPHVFLTRLKEPHQPGMPQPRNVGAHYAVEKAAGLGIELSHFWFVDSDCIVTKDCLLEFQRANVAAATEHSPRKLVGQRILVGRYDWLAPGVSEPDGGFEMVDPRSEALESREPSQTFVSDLSAGLACFSGNLIWPVGSFESVGGFWNEIHHGRCEDGELGLRAVKMGVPIAFVGEARAYHLWHERDFSGILARNERDVPMLNERHPWVEGRCNCGHQKTLHGFGVSAESIELMNEEANTDRETGMKLEELRTEGLIDDDYQPVRFTGPCKDCKCKKFEQALFVVEEDGRRFNARCKCGWEGNTAEIWSHEAECPIEFSIS